MYYELFSCSDVGHLPCFQSFWCFKQYCVAIIIHTPCAHAGVFLRYQEVDLLGHWMWVRHFTIFCPVVLHSGCTNLHTWVRVSVCILLTFCIADFSTFCHLPSICHVFTLTHWDLIGTLDLWHLWVSHLWA